MIFTSHSGMQFELKIHNNGKKYAKFIKSGNCQWVADGIRNNMRLKDYSQELVEGVGYASGNDCNPLCTKSKIFLRWRGMIRRCYSLPVSYAPLQYSEYRDTEVSSYWHSFNNFERWYKCQLDETLSICDFKESDLCVDKDLFGEYLERTYSPQSCCLLPKEINSAIHGLRWHNGEIAGLKSSRISCIESMLEKYSLKLQPKIVIQMEKIIDILKAMK